MLTAPNRKSLQKAQLAAEQQLQIIGQIASDPVEI
jgi:hypothetical protein